MTSWWHSTRVAPTNAITAEVFVAPDSGCR
jgi:hypothetical protein